VKTSPTQRSIAYLKKNGHLPWIVEKWNPHAKVRQDMYGWVDIVAVSAEVPGVLGVQTTTKHNMQARLHKALGNKALVAWIKAGGRLVIHGWQKKRGRWEVDCRPVTLMDLEMAS